MAEKLSDRRQRPSVYRPGSIPSTRLTTTNNCSGSSQSIPQPAVACNTASYSGPEIGVLEKERLERRFETASISSFELTAYGVPAVPGRHSELYTIFRKADSMTGSGSLFARFTVRINGHDRTAGGLDNLVGHGPEHYPLQPLVPMGAHDNQVAVNFDGIA